jgi:uncharacterized repeat protein (TIGR02543 family)
MRKSFALVAVVVFMLLAMFGCAYMPEETQASLEYGIVNTAQEQETTVVPNSQNDETGNVNPAYPAMRSPRPMPFGFSTLEEFLYALEVVRDGNANEALTNESIRTGFASLETLYLPANLPEAYRLVGITVGAEAVFATFAPENIPNSYSTGSDYFWFQFTRWTYEDLEAGGALTPLDGIMRQAQFTDEDLIDGRFFYGRTNEFIWAEGSNRLTLRIPSLAHDMSALDGGIIGFEANSVYDLLPLTETIAIDLTDDALVNSLIGNVYQIHFDYGEVLGEAIVAMDTAPISIPANANISAFLSIHSDFPMHAPIFDGIMTGDRFLGWYLDAGFTTPLIEFHTRMPEGDITLYARWELAPATHEFDIDFNIATPAAIVAP